MSFPTQGKFSRWNPDSSLGILLHWYTSNLCNNCTVSCGCSTLQQPVHVHCGNKAHDCSCSTLQQPVHVHCGNKAHDCRATASALSQFQVPECLNCIWEHKGKVKFETSQLSVMLHWIILVCNHREDKVHGLELSRGSHILPVELLPCMHVHEVGLSTFVHLPVSRSVPKIFKQGI